MNTNDLVRRIQRLIGDEAEVQVRVEDIKDWRDDAITELARELEFLTKTLNGGYGQTTTGIVIPADFIGEKRVTWNSDPLRHTNIGTLDGMETSLSEPFGAPTHYYVHEDKFWVYPQPAETKQLAVYYVANPAVSADDNAQLPLPGHLHKEVTRLVMIRARELNEDFDVAARLQSESQDLIGRARDDVQNRGNRDTYPVVRDDPADWWS